MTYDSECTEDMENSKFFLFFLLFIHARTILPLVIMFSKLKIVVSVSCMVITSPPGLSVIFTRPPLAFSFLGGKGDPLLSFSKTI